MNKSRKRFSPEFKAKVALEALKEQSTLAELCQKHELYSTQISKWKKELLQHAAQAFQSTQQQKKAKEDHNSEIERLHSIIGRQQVELDYLKKNWNKIQ